MNILFYILTVLFFSTNIAVAILFKKLKTKYETLLLELDDIKNNVLNGKKSGYYTYSTNLLSKELKEAGKTGDTYDCNIYVDELDRYTNGLSKIKLKKIEVINGFDPHQYEWVRTCAKDKFSELKKTSDIEWLESVETIKTIRKNKLAEIIKKIK
jgi:hypothetical protein